MVKFGVFEGSLFPCIISNVSKSTISASLCWNWGIFDTMVAGIKSHHFHGWAFSPWTAYRTARVQSGTVLRLILPIVFLWILRATLSICETRCVYFSSFFWGTQFFQTLLKYHRKRFYLQGSKEMTWSSFSHFLVIAKIKFFKPKIYKQIKWPLWTV